MELAGTDTTRISQIKAAVDEYNQQSFRNNNLLKFLIENSYFSLADQLIDLKIEEIFTSGQPLQAAVRKQKSELVSKILNNNADSNKDDYSFLLGLTIQNNDTECLRLLLQAGANPNEEDAFSDWTYFEQVFVENRTSLIPYFFNAKINHFPIDNDSIQKLEKYYKKSYKEQTFGQFENRFSFVDDFYMRLSRALPPLVEGLSCYTGFVANREKAIHRFIQPLIDPPASIKGLVAPLQKFLEKESLKSPQFTITLAPRLNSDGEYSPKTKNIQIDMNLLPCQSMCKGHPLLQNYDLQSPPSLRSLEDTPSTVLLHETCHKALDTLNWHVATNLESSLASSVDILDLSSRWEKCHPSVKKLLQNVKKNYIPQQRVEESLVRIPQILFELANEDKNRSLADIEKIMEKNVPNLYRIYKDKFLPALENYNAQA